MSELLLKKEHLRQSQPEDEVRKIARTRTLIVLDGLERGKRSVLPFLQESDLINKGKPIVDLNRARIWQAMRFEMDLRQADLSGAELWGSNFKGAFLCDANLSGANLTRADLSGANLIPSCDLREEYERMREQIDCTGSRRTTWPGSPELLLISPQKNSKRVYSWTRAHGVDSAGSSSTMRWWIHEKRPTLPNIPAPPSPWFTG